MLILLWQFNCDNFTVILLDERIQVYPHQRSRWHEEITSTSSSSSTGGVIQRTRHSASRWVCRSRNAAFAKYILARRMRRVSARVWTYICICVCVCVSSASDKDGVAEHFSLLEEAHLPSKQKEFPVEAHSPSCLFDSFLPHYSLPLLCTRYVQIRFSALSVNPHFLLTL